MLPSRVQINASDVELEPSVSLARAALEHALAEAGGESMGSGVGDSWTLEPKGMSFLRALLRTVRPSRVLEFGSGQSTVLLAAEAALYGGSVVSREHDPHFFQRTHAILATAEARTVDLRLCPLVARMVRGTRVPVYLDAQDEPPGTFDLVFVDGPPAALGGRQGSVYQALRAAKEGAIVLLDDAGRTEEQSVLRRAAMALGDALHIEALEGMQRGMAALVLTNAGRVHAELEAEIGLRGLP